MPTLLILVAPILLGLVLLAANGLASIFLPTPGIEGIPAGTSINCVLGLIPFIIVVLLLVAGRKKQPR